MPEGEDSLRSDVFEKLNKFYNLRTKADVAGKKYFSLNPEFDSIRWGEPLRVSLYPKDKESVVGWYTLEEFENWINGDPNSPVLRKNHEEVELRSAKYYRDSYIEKLKKLREADKMRLLQIGLMRCPYPDVVSEYYPEE